jgi:hypothetical protein|uniref:Uncharacterized protein n=1 Tax=viral metagenome TaxID=1070528 RepID=A0A6C0ILS8_9ZZZZ
MDDFVISNLNESRNEWCSRLVSIFTPLVNEGVRSIFNESWNLCVQNDEANKYLMTFQNFLTRIPKWNNEIIANERARIVDRSKCNYLEDLITCVHIIQLKVLTCIKVGNKQKQIDISIPKLDDFIHKVYIHTARKLYANVYLFEKNISPLMQQKNNRELEVIIQECILIAIRDSIPTEEIIRAYMDESIEQEEEVIIENIEEKEEEPIEEKVDEPLHISNDEGDEIETVPAIKDKDDKEVITRLTFNEVDDVLENNIKLDEQPTTMDDFNNISVTKAMEQYSDDEDERIMISDEPISLTDFEELEDPFKKSNEVVLDGVEVLY